MSYFIRFIRYMTSIEQYFQITEGEFCFCNCSLMVSDQPSKQGKLKNIDKIQNEKKKKYLFENCSKGLISRLGVFKTFTFQRKDWPSTSS